MFEKVNILFTAEISKKKQNNSGATPATMRQLADGFLLRPAEKTCGARSGSVNSSGILFCFLYSPAHKHVGYPDYKRPGEKQYDFFYHKCGCG